MPDHTISIPDELYQKAHQLAQQSSRTTTEVIRDRLADALNDPFWQLEPAEAAELKAMTYLSEPTLWMIAHERASAAENERVGSLLRKNTRGDISADELQELEALVEAGERRTLRKAQAMKVLVDRGIAVHLDDLAE